MFFFGGTFEFRRERKFRGAAGIGVKEICLHPRTWRRRTGVTKVRHPRCAARVCECVLCWQDFLPFHLSEKSG